MVLRSTLVVRLPNRTGPFAGIMVTDYWLVHHGRVDVPAMYDPHGRYRYTGGFNWRAVAAILCSVPPTLPGLISAINNKIVVGNATHLFDIAWIFGFTVASVVYYVTSTLWPAKETYLDAAITPDSFAASQPESSVSEEDNDMEKVSLDKVAVRTEVQSAHGAHTAAPDYNRHVPMVRGKRTTPEVLGLRSLKQGWGPDA